MRTHQTHKDGGGRPAAPAVTGRADRRRLLGFGVGAVAAFAGASVIAEHAVIANAQADRELVGSWMVAGTPTGAPSGGPARLLVSFSADGIALRTAPLQQAAPAALGVGKMLISTTHGEWVRTGDREFGLTFVGFAFDDAGQFLATQRIRVAVRVDDASMSFSGPFRTDFVGADGTVKASSAGTVEGTRIVVEAVD
jgi:hypothetical protein